VAKAKSVISSLIACLKASSRDITDYSTIIYSVWLYPNYNKNIFLLCFSTIFYFSNYELKASSGDITDYKPIIYSVWL
jgi:hypothetical protein